MNEPSSAVNHVLSHAPSVLVLGGGCFWCTEAVFERMRGLVACEVGYANGDAAQYPRPTYEQVCQGDTGYNEVVRLTFDPAQVQLPQLLDVFFLIHDPTTLNRQGHDVGTQYRSGIYTTTPEQAEQVQAYMQALKSQDPWGKPVVTECLPLLNYHRAEAYHQRFFAHNPGQGYCLAVAAPKVDKFLHTFREWVKN